MGISQNAKELQQMIAQGKSFEALDKFYAENVQVTEMPSGEVRNGKEAQRKAIQDWYGMVKEAHDGGCKSISVDEENDITMAETWMDITFQDGNRVVMSEVAVQKWDDGKIVDEKFYYNMPGQ